MRAYLFFGLAQRAVVTLLGGKLHENARIRGSLQDPIEAFDIVRQRGDVAAGALSGLGIVPEIRFGGSSS